MTVLHIDASINGESSASRAISRSIVDQLTIERGGAEFVYRDLAAEPIAAPDARAFADTSVLDEFLAADTVVIGAPMYNFTLPDPAQGVDRPNRRCREDLPIHANGPEGLAKGKRVIVALARGGFYNEGSPASALEHLETYLRGIFNFIGIEPEFVSADGLSVSPEQRGRVDQDRARRNGASRRLSLVNSWTVGGGKALFPPKEIRP